MKSSPFDHRPLQDIADGLRQVLGQADDPAFVRRVMEKARSIDSRMYRGDGWDVLDMWARPGMVAAAAIVVLVTVSVMALGRVQRPDDATIDDALSATVGGPEISLRVASPFPPNVDVVFAVALER